MADKKPGPVKPPILDMTARESAPATPEAQKTTPAAKKSQSPQAAPKPDTQASARKTSGSQDVKKEPDPDRAKEAGADTPAGKSDDTPKGPPPPPPPPAPPQRPGPGPGASRPQTAVVVATALVGGVTGLALAYGLALGGLWPQPEQGPSEDMVAGLETRIGELEATRAEGATSGSALAERLEALEIGLSDTAASIAALGEAAPASATGDFASLAETVTALAERVEALGSATTVDTQDIPAPDTGEIEARLAALEADYEDALAQIQTLGESTRTADDRIADLETRIADQSDFDALNAERERLVQLPGALTALEEAIGLGSAFANELSAVLALSPGLEPGAEALAAASSGVKSARTLLAEFRALIPDLIAARPAEGDTSWFETLLDQASAAIALRPTGDEGDGAAALVGRTETALDTGDLARAREIIALYPPDMAEIAQPIDQDIAAHIAARAVLSIAQTANGASEAAQ